MFSNVRISSRSPPPPSYLDGHHVPRCCVCRSSITYLPRCKYLELVTILWLDVLIGNWIRTLMYDSHTIHIYIWTHMCYIWVIVTNLEVMSNIVTHFTTCMGKTKGSHTTLRLNIRYACLIHTPTLSNIYFGVKIDSCSLKTNTFSIILKMNPKCMRIHNWPN